MLVARESVMEGDGCCLADVGRRYLRQNALRRSIDEEIRGSYQTALAELPAFQPSL